MKKFNKWRNSFFLLSILMGLCALWLLIRHEWTAGTLMIFSTGAVLSLFISLWKQMKKKGLQTDVDIQRVLGKDAKDALNFGEVGIITFNEEGIATWASSFLRDEGLDLVNHKLTGFLENIRELIDENVDTITGTYKGQVYEVRRKENARVLFVRNITELTELKAKLTAQSIVVGLMTLDNYDEYQSYENEEILNEINTRLRTPLIVWCRENGIFLRRIRSDRFLVILDTEILERLRRDNFSILQKIKDEADALDVNITLSMVFAQSRGNFGALDHSLNELLELVQSRGGDQVAIKTEKKRIEFIGGNSEKSSQRSKVRVSIVESSIQDLVGDSRKVFILGHVNTDYDAMGSALAMSSWVRALGKEAFVVLKDVPRDAQLQDTLDHYRQALAGRVNLITEEEALRLVDGDRDLVVMVDHSNPAISSGRHLLDSCGKIIVIDHHRRAEGFPKNPLLSYIETSASSTAELMTELLQNSSRAIPIYEPEATILYLGMLVDTNRFKSHTSERTFQAAAALRSWGANANVAEKALQEDYAAYRLRSDLIQQAVPYNEHILIAPLHQPVSRTLLSQISDSLLSFKGTQAAFTIGVNQVNGNIAVSARSDGSFNVQKVMEKMKGGGHFAAAALERENTTVEAVCEELKGVLDELEAAEKKTG